MPVQLLVRGPAPKQSLAVSLPETASVESLKTEIQRLSGLPSVDQTLSLDGRVLEDLCTLKDYDLTAAASATVELSVPVLGGKVHGSLARAGKVRGQTPKVEAQEKKKRVVGRSKRRVQYNRRFVNVVPTMGGRKRGPNSQDKA